MPAEGPARNRVTPFGDIVAVPGRGAWMGNRGVLHVGAGARDIVRNSRARAWITCVVSFKDRKLPQWEPGRNTQLFFLDEAVALAAGHRPCAECRRNDYNAYRSAWADGDASAPGRRLPYAKEMDARLSEERATSRTRGRLLHQANWLDLPDGSFVVVDAGPAVVSGDYLAVWMPDNTYGIRLTRPQRGAAWVITPPASVAVLRAGHQVQIDESGPQLSLQDAAS